MLAVGRGDGELTDLLSEVADFYSARSTYALKNLSAALEPLLIVGVGGMVLVAGACGFSCRCGRWSPK